MSLHRAYLLLALLGLVSCGEPPLPPAPQGAWVSSGGELFKDANNPWFVKNTPRVTYCIAVDRDSFSASPETVETLVSKAIGYWKEQFSPYNTYQTSGALGIATQDFVREECQPSTDVRFLLGFGRLPPREAAYVGSTHALISAAVRTDYDEESLRGKGFIYVASDRGAHAYDSHAALVSEAWRYGGLLYRVLVHELGHVFGIPHLSTGIMSAEYPEFILHQVGYTRYAELSDLGTFFLPPLNGTYVNCSLSREGRELFSLTPDQKCLIFSLKRNVDQIDFFSARTPSAAKAAVGRAKPVDQSPFVMELRLGILLYVTPHQKVFNLSAAPDKAYVPGPLFGEFGFSMKLTDRSGHERPLYLRVGPDTYEILTLDEGNLRSAIYFHGNCKDLEIPKDMKHPDGHIVMHWRLCLEP